MMFESYESYKDSGIEWLGDIPNEWEIKRVKDYTKTFSGTTPKSGKSYYYDNGKTYWIRTTDLNNNELFDAEYKITKRAFEDYSLRLLPLNSVLVAMYGGIGTIGKNSIIKTKATLNQSVCAIVSNEYRFHSKFLLYFMQYFRYKWILFADSARKDPNINQDAIKNLFTIFPPLKTQQKIATYLDNQTQKIDKEIELLEKKIKQYKELKQTLINEIVLRGLDKNVELKDSGVEWIGSIPKGWKIKRFKDVAFIKTGNSIANKEDFEIKENAYPYIATKDINIDINTIHYDNSIYVPKSNKKFKVAKKHTTLICIEGGSAGRKIAFTNQKVCYVNKLCGVKSKPQKILDEYIYYFMKSLLFKNQFFSVMNGLIGGVSIGIMKNFSILVPIPEKQHLIVNYLDKKNNQINQIIKTIESKTELQKEFKKTLINDVVTGKVKV